MHGDDVTQLGSTKPLCLTSGALQPWPEKGRGVGVAIASPFSCSICVYLRPSSLPLFQISPDLSKENRCRFSTGPELEGRGVLDV